MGTVIVPDLYSYMMDNQVSDGGTSANFDSKNAGGIGQKVIQEPIKNTMSYFGMIRFCECF